MRGSLLLLFAISTTFPGCSPPPVKVPQGAPFALPEAPPSVSFDRVEYELRDAFGPRIRKVEHLEYSQAILVEYSVTQEGTPAEILASAQQDTARIFEIIGKSGHPFGLASAKGIGVAAGEPVPFLSAEIEQDDFSPADTFSRDICKTYEVGDVLRLAIESGVDRVP